MQFILGLGKRFCLDSHELKHFCRFFEGNIMARLYFLLFIFALMPLNTAQALDINQQGADQLKSAFQNLLDYQKTTNDAMGSVLLEYQGDLTVQQEATYYSVTFPHIFVKVPPMSGVDEDAIGTFDVGVIKVNAMPDEKAGYWKTIITLPSTMTLKGKTPEEDFSVSFADQKSIALFNEALGYFTKMDLNISGITFKSAGADVGVNVGGFQIYTKLEDQGNNTFTGPGHVLLSNLNIAPPEEKGNANIGELKGSFSFTDIQMPTLKEYQEKILKHSKTFKSLQNIEQTDEDAPVNGTDIIGMITDLYDFDMGGFTFEYSAKDININSDLDNEFRQFDTLRIGAASLGMGLENVQTEAGSLAITGGYDTISVTPADPEYSDVMPQSMNVNIKALNLPYGTLSKVATNTVNAIATDPQTAQMAGLGVLMRLPAILAQANTQIVVEKNGAKNSIYDFSLNGKVLTDLSAMTGFTAQFNAVFEGLDTLYAITQKNAANEDSDNAWKFEEMSQKLERLKAVGKAQSGPNGKPAYGYKIEATPDGKLLVNGQDATTVFSPAPAPQ